MRILLASGIYPPDAGGPATYTRALARALSSSGEHQVEVVAYGDQDGVSREDGYPVQRIGRNRNLFGRYWNFFLAVYRRAKQNDVVYLQGPVSEGLPGTLAAMLAGKPTVMKVVGDYAWEMYMQSNGTELLDQFLKRRHSGKIWMLEMIERWTVTRAKRIITPSHYLKKVVTRWGAPEKNIEVIYNGIEELSTNKSRDSIRRAFDVEEKRVLLTAVRAVPWKGGDFLIGLLPEVKDVTLVIAGDGPSLDAWKNEAKKMNVSDRVRFLGRADRSTLSEWYLASDAFALASGYEGFAHVIPEACSMGLHCFVSNQGGNPETRDLVDVELIDVLPYQDRQAWIDALRQSWPAIHHKSALRHLFFEEMIERTIPVLTSVV
jgi:glycosyltransferase involved in cell wall biosynthesis